MIGEGGADSVWHEKQRISIASLFYKDAPIIILDEATSIEALTHDKTIIKEPFTVRKPSALPIRSLY